MKFNCACCRAETDDDDAEMIYLGMGSSQYICPKCQKLPFETVMDRADEDDSPRYIGDKLESKVLGGKVNG